VPTELIIVSREQAELYASLKRDFAHDPEITVLMDRRFGERRRAASMPAPERRRQERRSRQEAAMIAAQGFVRVLAGVVEPLPDEHPEITRTGPPTPQHVSGHMFTWTLTVNRFPSKAWREFFVDTKDRSIDCSPDKVRFYQTHLIFDSDEKMLPAWIQFIARWMQAANERYLKYVRDQRRARKVQQETARDPKDRLREAAERFKHL
jgi:hypothetical protein